MTLLFGTEDGLYVAPDGVTEDAGSALDAAVSRLERFEGPGTLAATADGVYRSLGGREWTRLGPDVAVRSVLATPKGRIYAGAGSAGIHASDDGGETWRELDGFEAAVRRTGSAHEETTVRTLAATRGNPERVLAGVDPGGVFVTADGGDSWVRRSRGIETAHHLLAVGPERGALPSDAGANDASIEGIFVASAGDGVYWTADAGETWRRLDARAGDSRRRYWEATIHEDVLFVTGREVGEENPEAVVTRYDGSSESGTARRVVPPDAPEDSEFGTARRVVPPGAPEEFVPSLASHMGRLLAGTMHHDENGVRPDEPGRVLVREPNGDWRTLGRTPAGVTSLLGV